MNTFSCTGNLGKNAVLGNNDTPVLNFTLANNVGFGERRTTQWIDCSLWGNRAMNLAPYLQRGSRVFVTGELTLREYQKRDGTNGYSLSLRVSDLELLGQQPGQQLQDNGARMADNASGQQFSAPQNASGQQFSAPHGGVEPTSEPANSTVDLDNIPF